MGFTGPIFSPQGACASGNHAIGIGARMIRDGDCDFALVGGVDTCLVPEIVQGFANMLATAYITPQDRAFSDPTQASRPFSIDRKGMILSEGAGVLVLAAEEALATYGLDAEGRSHGHRLDLGCAPLHGAQPADDRARNPRGDRRRGARSGRHRPRQRPRHLDPEGRQGRGRMPAGGVRAEAARTFPFARTSPRSVTPWGPRRPSRRRSGSRPCARG